MESEAGVQKIILSNDVQQCIELVLQSQDPLNQADFNATDYINQLFPNEQSLSNIDDVINKMELQISEIDDNIRTVVRSQSNTGEQGRVALEEAQKTITQLFSQITDIKERAEKTESMVKEITCDIKQLDCAKKNLTSAITILNHLHMLFGGVESLVTLAEKRQYGEILNPLQAITEVNQYFKQYTEIPQIQTLSSRVIQIHSELATQITEDFKNCFTASSNPNANKMSMKQLSDACKVVSVLDPKVKRELLKWYVNLQLQEYVQLFHENQDIAWLDKIDKRYAWIKRHLLDFEDKYGKIFPMDWEVSERIAVHFCNITRDDLAKIMSKRRTEMDVKLLLFAIQKTSAFEQLLVKRFTGATFEEGKPQPVAATQPKSPTLEEKIKMLEIDGTTPTQEQPPQEVDQPKSPFTDLIGSCFKVYLELYTDSIDRNLSELIEKFVRENQKDINEINAGVFPSCADLFVFYKKCMVQCTQLCNGKTMFDLANVFKKYLREYASKVLESKIPKITQDTKIPSIGSSMSMLTKDLQNLPTAIHSFLKEGEAVRYTKEEVVRICCIMTTAEYCLETVQQLEDKLKEKVETAYKDSIDLSEEKDIFHRVISNSIHLLVQDVEGGCDPALIAMSKVQWQNISQVGDQSPFVNSIITHFKQSIPLIRDNLATSRKYYTQFCHKFVNSFIPKYMNNLYKCRPTNAQDGFSNIMGCEQLLLDTHSLKTILLDLPSVGSQVNRKAPTSYTKVVIKGMTKAEMIIKIVMASTNPPQQFIEQYLKLLPESSLGEFYKVLEMKGIKKQDQASLVELYKKLAPKESLTETDDMGANSADGEKGKSLKKFENLLRKRFP